MLSRTRTESELSLAIVASNWKRALEILSSSSARKLASRWGKSQGVFDGKQDAKLLPLHTACMRSDIPVSVVNALIDAYPEAVFQPESAFQRLPLHCACRAGVDTAIVQALVTRGGEDCCVHGDTLGRLPIYYALSNGARKDVIQVLLTTSKRSAAHRDHKDWTPLHVAASVGCSLEVLEQVFAAYPKAVVLKTYLGSTPLQSVGRKKVNRAELQRFLKERTPAVKSNTSALSKQDRVISLEYRSLPVESAILV